jgi:hypothetical protein
VQGKSRACNCQYTAVGGHATGVAQPYGIRHELHNTRVTWQWQYAVLKLSREDWRLQAHTHQLMFPWMSAHVVVMMAAQLRHLDKSGSSLCMVQAGSAQQHSPRQATRRGCTDCGPCTISSNLGLRGVSCLHWCSLQ